jgi:catechol 2,3-dioxygenase-like lactoylglutathione lyase family enzyme
MKHLALAVSDQQRSRRFYETYFGFDAQPPRRYDDGVLMLSGTLATLYVVVSFLGLSFLTEEVRVP